MVYLLELDYARETWRFATTEDGRSLEVDGETYLGGLEVGEVILQAGLFRAQTETPGAAVTLGHWPGDRPLGAMVGGGQSLWGAPCRLSVYSAELGRARVVLVGKVVDPDLGAPGESHTFTLEASSYEDVAQIPSLSQVITETNWPEHHEDASQLAYPIPFGAPGVYKDAEGNEHKTAGSPAPVVEWLEPPSVEEGTAYQSVRVCAPWRLLIGDMLDSTGSAVVYQLDGDDSGPIVDGVQLQEGDRVLCPYQGNTASDHYPTATPSQDDPNGIYRVARDDTGGTAIWRLLVVSDFFGTTDIDENKRVYVEEGEIFGGRWFKLEAAASTGIGFVAYQIGGAAPTFYRLATKWTEVGPFGAQKLLASGELVDASAVRVFSDAVIKEGDLELNPGNFASVPLEDTQDGLGQPAVVVDLTTLELEVSIATAATVPTPPVYAVTGTSTTGANPYKWRMGTSYHLAWDEGRALLRADEPSPAVHLGHMLQWVLSRSSLAVDHRRMAALMDRASAIEVSGYIDEAVSPLDVVTTRWMKLLPMAIRRGALGLRIDIARLGGAPRRRLVVGENCSRASPWQEQFLRRGGPLNEVRVSFAKSTKSGTWKRGLLVGADLDGVDHLDSLPAELSQSRYGRASEQLEEADLWTATAAAVWAAWRLQAFALPVLRTLLWVPEADPAAESELVGVPVEVEDEDFGISRAGMVDEVRVPAGGGGLLLGVVVWDLGAV